MHPHTASGCPCERRYACVHGRHHAYTRRVDIIENCLNCKMRAEHIFCDLPPAALQAFESIKYATTYPKGAVLLVEGQAPRGIYVLSAKGA